MTSSANREGGGANREGGGANRGGGGANTEPITKLYGELW